MPIHVHRQFLKSEKPPAFLLYNS